MNRKSKASAVLALSMAATLPLAACGGGGGDTSTAGTDAYVKAEKGGTLYYLSMRALEHGDPTRMYIGRDITNASRTIYRGLLQFPVGQNDNIKSQTPVPDIATDTGTANADKTEWKFTLKEGVKWQDGKPVTCEDFKYGVSRSFASDVLDGGPFQYPTGYLDIPQKDGKSVYEGPYKKTGQADFDKAVSCSGNTITYKFNKPWKDFPLAIAALHSFDPYRKDKDQGAKGDYQFFSNGPYKLEGKWSKAQGGTFVRNDQYDAKTDGVREANPDKIVYQWGVKDEVVASRLVADSGNDKFAVTDRRVTPEQFGAAQGTNRATLIRSPYVFYLVPNMNRMTNPKVREALKVATNVKAYITAQGGDKASATADSIVNPDVPGYEKIDNFTSGPPEGDPAAAKKLLEEAGVKTPYPLKVTYQSGSPRLDNAFAALKQTWDAAGFNVTLDPLADTYYDIVNKPSNDSDVFQGGWGADYPSLATVVPLLFDSRQLSSANVGNNYGQYKNVEVDKLITEGQSATDDNAANEAFNKAGKIIADEVGYIPTDIQMFYFLRGSKVTGYLQTGASNGFPDLGSIGVAK